MASANEPAPQLPVEEVIVTGTHIKGLDLEGALQAVTLNRDDIASSGAATVSDLLSQLSQTEGGNASFSAITGGPGSDNTPTGSAAIALRGLGASSTLTLINGRRIASNAFANGAKGSFIDVNSIPLSAIERVEIIPTGSSAAYGADAVGGVINYVLRDDFEGTEVSISYGNSAEDSDDSKSSINVIWGGKFGDSVRATLFADVYDRNALMDKDRSLTENPLLPDLSNSGTYPAHNDLFLMFDDQVQDDANGCNNVIAGDFGDVCSYNGNAFTTTYDEREALSLGGLFEVELSDTMSWFTEVMYSKNKSQGTNTPSSFSRNPIDPENPNIPLDLQTDMINEAIANGNAGTVFPDFYGFPVYIWGRFSEPRQVEVESESARLLTGLEGEFDNGWSWETAVSFSENENTQKGVSGYFVTETLYNAMAGNYCTDGSLVDRWDIDISRRDASFNGDTCEGIGKTTWWPNIWDGDPLDDPLIASASTSAERTAKSEQFSWDAKTSGALFELPAGDLMAAFGVEYREEKVVDEPSAIATSTPSNPDPVRGFSSTDVDYQRDSYAAYAELFIPVTDEFEVQLQGRYDHFDDFGDTFNPKVGLRYQPAEELILRGSWSTSFRAPSLSQSGLGTILSDGSINCDEADLTGTELCRTNDPRLNLTEDVGNPNLQPEEAETWSVGFIFKPFENTEIQMDYFHIFQEDVVDIDNDAFYRDVLAGLHPVIDIDTGELIDPNTGAVLATAGDAAFDSVTSVDPATGDYYLTPGVAGVEVDADGISDAHYQLTNLGHIKVRGFDFMATQWLDTDTAGSFRFRLEGTYLQSYDVKTSDFNEVETLAGEFSYPRLVATASVRWRYENFSTELRGKYKSGYDEDIDRVDDSGYIADLNAEGYDTTSLKVDSETIWDLNISYDFYNNSYISFSVKNLFDEEPPLSLSDDDIPFDSANYDSMGRYYTLNYVHSF
ncbi:MAG: TonB-dependent receptor [Candidatus Pelagadaptatus aseana]